MSRGPRGKDRAPWSLRRRLVAGVVLLLALLSALIGTVTTIALHGDLMERLDKGLLTTLHGPLSKPQAAMPPAPGPTPGNAHRLRDDTLACISVTRSDGGSEVVRAEYVDREGVSITLSPMQHDQLFAALSQGDGPVSVTLDGLGRFRVAKTTTEDGRLIIAGRSLREVESTITSLILITAGTAAGAIAIGAFAAWRMIGAAMRPLNRVAVTATRVSERPLAEGRVRLPERVPAGDTDPRTEVGQVGAALNRLLGHVEDSLNARQRSEDQLRRFIADASHELRTPLASVRGYAELTSRDTQRLSEDQRHSLGRISAEAIRMSALVEDLLLLARLDAGQRPRMDDVDMSRLVVDAVSDAMAADPDRRWELDVRAEEMPVHGDPHRLQQVIANLLANARAHTPPGTTVTAGVAREGDEIVIRVHDDGPGIAPGLLPAVFDRFVRGDASRTRHGASSSGLGLSISQAIADSHGGTISVRSVPGDTCFTVRLPAA